MPLGARFSQILEGAQNRDDEAFAEIYREFAPAVAGYVRANGARELDDVTSETFIAVARNIRRFSGDEAAFRAWLFTIAHRRLIDERRARGRRKDEARDPATMPSVSAASSESVALEGLELEQVEQLLGGLTPDQREVVVLRILAGLSVKDVARAVHKSESAVKVLQHRAVNALARQLAPVTDGTGPAMTGAE